MAFSDVPLKVLTPAFLTSLANFVKAEKNIEGEVVITHLEEESGGTGGCESCAYTYHEMNISYSVDGKSGGYYVYDGSFDYLVNRLVDL
jgi:hypothetical protein